MKFVKAERRAIPVSIGLKGKSGSGKTFSALKLAQGLDPDGLRVLLDTEKGRGRMYAGEPGIGEYEYAEIEPPFTPDAFVQAIQAAADHGATTIIVDSASHEWTGIGGCLEQADAIAAKGEKFRLIAWAKVKPQHRRFVNLVAAPPVNLILCLRAKDAIEEKTVNGKKIIETLPEPVAEQQKDFAYELTASALIGQDHTARWDKVPGPLKGALSPGLITEEHGEAIAKWTAGGKAVNPAVERHLAGLREAAFEGLAAMRSYWRENIQPEGKSPLVPDDVNYALREKLPELQEQAERVDRLREQEREATEAGKDDEPQGTGELTAEGPKSAAAALEDPFSGKGGRTYVQDGGRA